MQVRVKETTRKNYLIINLKNGNVKPKKLGMTVVLVTVLTKFRLWLARKILGQHCACYAMGYHKLYDFRKRKTK